MGILRQLVIVNGMQIVLIDSINIAAPLASYIMICGSPLQGMLHVSFLWQWKYCQPTNLSIYQNLPPPL